MSLAESAEFAGMADADKILVRSNGTVTYTGKDIAVPALEARPAAGPDGASHDFGYRPSTGSRRRALPPRCATATGKRTLFRTTSPIPAERPAGAALRCRLDGLQRHRRAPVVPPEGGQGGHPRPRPPRGGRELDPLRLRDGGAHAGRRAAPRGDAGPRLPPHPEDMGKPFIEMSGRRGHRGEGGRAARHPDPGGGEGDRRAPARGSRSRSSSSRACPRHRGRRAPLPDGAPGSEPVSWRFDFDEALAFEGDTGPYLQYSAVRANKIFEKLGAQGLAGSAEEDARAPSRESPSRTTSGSSCWRAPAPRRWSRRSVA